ncbi:MAG: aldehyde ferredoxin oxidoreductase C-terminal domain-containing protein, partial [Desulfotomaculales bacterium]
ASGWDVDIPALLCIGERATNLARIFNLREGFSRKDDTLPERLFQPSQGGPLAGRSVPRDDFERALTAEEIAAVRERARRRRESLQK